MQLKYCIEYLEWVQLTPKNIDFALCSMQDHPHHLCGIPLAVLDQNSGAHRSNCRIWCEFFVGISRADKKEIS